MVKNTNSKNKSTLNTAFFDSVLTAGKMVFLNKKILKQLRPRIKESFIYLID
jgi:hypothetical protein